jgi:hypothetical protein
LRIRWTSFAAGIACAALAAGIVPVGHHSQLIGPVEARAQNLGSRIVSGTVVDANSVAVANATVFLKDSKSKSIRSYSTDAAGHFRFTQVSMVEDHDLWAEKDGKKSTIKNVSTWDTRKDFVSELKLK